MVKRPVRRKFVRSGEIYHTNFRLKAELRTFHTVSEVGGVETSCTVSRGRFTNTMNPHYLDESTIIR